MLKLPAVAVTVTVLLPEGVVVPLPAPLLLPPQPERAKPNTAKRARTAKNPLHLRPARKMPPRPKSMHASRMPDPALPWPPKMDGA